MKSLIAVAALATASNAAAEHISLTIQSGIANDQYSQIEPTRNGKPVEAGQGGLRPSKSATRAIFALQRAVSDKDLTNLPARIASAQSAVRTADDRFILASLRLRAAALVDDLPGMESAADALVSTGRLPAASGASIFATIAHGYYDEREFDSAARAAERALASAPDHVEAIATLAETRAKQGRTADAVILLQRGIDLSSGPSRKAEESWHKRVVALAFRSRLPNATELARQWVAAYPSAASWRDTIRIYQATSELDDEMLLDSMRLAQAAGALDGGNDYYRFAGMLLNQGFAGEAAIILEQGFATGSIERAKPEFGQLHAQAAKRSQGDQASLPVAASKALGSQRAREAMTVAEAHYGYGDYRKSAELFRAALGKDGVDRDLANLRLGMALALAGDQTGAIAALNTVGGARASLARLWLTFLATNSPAAS